MSRNAELEALTGLPPHDPDARGGTDHRAGARRAAPRRPGVEQRASRHRPTATSCSRRQGTAGRRAGGRRAAATRSRSRSAPRGRRSIGALPAQARGHTIGTVSLVRPRAMPHEEGVRLLRLLVDEMAVAVQNAATYREKLERRFATRSPACTTGVSSSRRWTRRSAVTSRYGSCASLVMFDVDDFQKINDRHGHAVGDRRAPEIATVGQTPLRRPTRSPVSGGEEFALLLPETQQPDALLVAERVRTAIGRSTMLADRRVTLPGCVPPAPGRDQPRGPREEGRRRPDWAKRTGRTSAPWRARSFAPRVRRDRTG